MLEKWINPIYLDDARTSQLRADFETDPVRMLILDDVLLPERYARISQGLRTDCDWTTHYGVDASGELTSAERFDATPADRRLFRHGNYRAPKKGRELAPGMLAIVSFKILAGRPDFMNWLQALTGITTTSIADLLVRRMGLDDFSTRHDDRAEERRLCLLLYFNDDWRPDMGGQFRVFTPDGVRIIDPLPNRAILFDVNADQSHGVDSLLNVPVGWYRYNFTLWLG
ncbi:2OG-Fe(II) oxygenase family protein [Tistrella mobilis]|uniref:2OG-Fe(II) oxygenase n=1 Tax=Tistrella mobilis TaxID=171437 RepID=UPI0035577D1A